VNYYIGVDGAAQIAEALKVNTTLTVLGLGGEWRRLTCFFFSLLSILSTFHSFRGLIRQCNWWCWC